ncbi:MAG: hypothetical protein WBC92_02435 [Terracidiphilus sp.]
MKKNMTLSLAALILAVTLTAFPNVAAADTTTAPTASASQIVRKAGGSNLIYVQLVLAAGSLLSTLLA